MATTTSLIRQIKRRIPKGRKVYLDGHYKDENQKILWWYAHKEDGILWIEYECNDGYGRCAQHAEDFDPELLESVLDSMTATTVPNSFPVGATMY